MLGEEWQDGVMEVMLSGVEWRVGQPLQSYFVHS